MHIPLLGDIIIILGLSVLVIFIFNKLKLPTILGFLITGIIIGPKFLQLVRAVHEVELLAEIGVVLLLFTIGLEFSLTDMFAIKKAVLLGGSLQVLLTTIFISLITIQFGLAPGQAIFIGFLISLSSTAIVLKLLQEKGEIDSPHGKTTLGILIFQDIIVVPMVLFTPLLSGGSENVWWSLSVLAVKGIIIIIVVYVLAKFLMPKFLYQVARTKSNELFLLSVLVICLVVAWITSSIGLSLALGAFLAGLIISESQYSHQAVSNIIPFKEIFESFFFVSIGMLLDVSFFKDHFIIILAIAAIVIALKFFFAGIAAFFLKLPLRTVILVALSLAQVGEFSFILSKIGMDYNLINGNLNQYFLSVSILSMSATPFIIKFAHRITYLILKAPLPKYFINILTKRKYDSQAGTGKKIFRNHLVVIGYGLNGKNVVKAARYAVIPYIIVEMNADTVKEEREKGEPIFFGDAVHEEVLKHVSIQNARVAVIAISDLISSRRIVSNIRNISQSVYLIVRTRYIHEIELLKNLGADVVVAEEFETSIEIFTRVLTKYLMPRNEIENFINVIRSDGYEMLRSLPGKEGVGQKIHDNLTNVDIATIKLSGHCTMLGKTLAEADMRNKFGITLLAIKHKDDIINNPYGDTKLEKDDLLFVFGEPDKIAKFNNFMEKK